MKSQWLGAGLDALRKGGVGAVRVERLAAEVGVTKGSFYHHFANLDGLVKSLLFFWEAEATEAVIRTLDQVKDPRERLRRLFELSWDRVDHLKAEAALAAAAVAGDPRILPTYLRVNKRRFHYTRSIYRALGLAAREAERMALVAYGSYLGTLQLVALGGGPFRSRAELREHAAHLARTLLP